MKTTSPNLVEDLAALWSHESCSFLRYLVEMSEPVAIDEPDREILAVFREFHAAEEDLRLMALDLWARLGRHPDLPSFPLEMSLYNYMRPVALGRAYLRIVGRELADLRGMVERYAEAEDLEARLMRRLVLATVEHREGSLKRVEKTLAQVDAAGAGGAAASEAAEEELVGAGGEFPWHDEDLTMAQRMKLASGRGLFEKLFASMAQTDCTACGYDCEGYARAIAEGREADLSKCAPGELETQEMLEKLMGKR